MKEFDLGRNHERSSIHNNFYYYEQGHAHVDNYDIMHM